jgi:NADH-quinone oxidoreductase subunit M
MITLALIGFPLLLSLALFAIRRDKLVKYVALWGSLAEFGWAVFSWVNFEHYCKCSLQFRAGWLEEYGISLQFGMDGISLMLVMLTTFLVPLIILSTWKHRYPRPSDFYGMIILMDMALVGVFTAFDGLMFYIFWEMALIPAWLICALWGGKERVRVTFKFFLYTFIGSLFMLTALIWLYFRTPLPHSFDVRSLYAAGLTPAEQSWIFAAFTLAFLIKIPVFPFHTWQPDTYSVSPAAGSMLLAGIMMKMGLYGMIRWLIPVTPGAVAEYGMLVILLAVAGIVYASLIAIRQDDMKRLVAYSSIAHAGLIAAGLLTLQQKALEGAVLQMISHGINITGLFAVISFIESRTGTRNISSLGGMANRAPWLAFLFMIILLGSMALPLTNGFVGEFLLLLGLFGYHMTVAVIAGLTVIFTAVYMLWMYQRTMLGYIPGSSIAEGKLYGDLSWPEALTLIPLAILVIWIGIDPGFFLDPAVPALKEILENVMNK